MDKYGYSGEEKFRPLSTWAYFGYGVLFMLPVVGLIILIVLCFNDNNINRRNFARSHFCGLLIAAVIALLYFVAFGVGLSGALGGMLGTLARY